MIDNRFYNINSTNKYQLVCNNIINPFMLYNQKPKNIITEIMYDT